jgi:hypothetical protein
MLKVTFQMDFPAFEMFALGYLPDNGNIRMPGQGTHKATTDRNFHGSEHAPSNPFPGECLSLFPN